LFVSFLPDTHYISLLGLRFYIHANHSPLNFFPYKLKELGSGEEDIYSLEYGEEPLATKDGRMVVLNGIYQFILRDVSPSRDKALHKLLLENFLHANKQPWYPAGACILVMVPDMIENSAPAESWYSIGSPLDPPESHSVEDIDDWIIRAVERDGYYGLEVSVENSANDQKKNHSAPLDREGLNQSIST
jgi:hypothetical protein